MKVIPACTSYIKGVFSRWHMSSLQKVFDVVKILENRELDDSERETVVKQAKVSAGFLIAALSHPSPIIRLRVVRLMKDIKDQRTVEDLANTFVNDDSFEVRDEAGNALACMENAKAVNALIDVISNGQCTWRTAEKLEMASPLSLEPLINLLETADQPYVRTTALAILQKISGQDHGPDISVWNEWLGENMPS